MASVAASPVSLGRYQFINQEQLDRLNEHPTFVKEHGRVINPLNWPTMARALLSGAPQRSVDIKALVRSNEAGSVFIVDGFDDLMSAIQSSGLPQQLVAALQSFFLYPVILPLVQIGHDGAVESFSAAGEEMGEHAQSKQLLRDRIVQSLVREVVLKRAMAPLLRDETLTQLSASDPKEFQRRATALATLVKELVAENVHRQKLANSEDDIEPVAARQLLSHLRSDRQFYVQMKELLELLAQKGDDPKILRRIIADLAAYKRELDSTHDALFDRLLASPLAVLGTGFMWWTMALYEGAALADVMGGPGAAAASQGLSAAGASIMPVGQLGMAAYGLFQGLQGQIQDGRYHEQLRQIADSRLLTGDNTDLRHALIAQIHEEQKINTLSKRTAGPLLATGQTMMVIGGPAGAAVGAGLPILVTGALVTGVAIGLKITGESIRTLRFSYDPKALGEFAELLNDGVRGADDACLAGVNTVRAEREIYLTRLACLKMVKQVRALRAEAGSLPVEDLRALLERRLHTLYQREYQHELRARITAMLNEPQWLPVITQLLTHADNDAFLTYVVLCLEEHSPRSADVDDECHDAWEEFISASSQRRLELMRDKLKTFDLYDDTMGKLLKDLVIDQQSRQNRRGAAFEPYVVRDGVVLKQGTLKIPLVPTISTWRKNKTVYSFNMDKLIADMDNTVRMRTLESCFYQAARQSTFGLHKFRTRSRLMAANAAVIALVAQDALREQTHVSMQQDPRSAGEAQAHAV